MPIVLEKLLQDLFLAPLGWALWLLVAAFYSYEKSKPHRAKGFILAAFIVLYLFSTNIAAKILGRPLEQAYPAKAMADYPQSQAIVVLGGSTYGLIPPRTEVEEVGGARVLGAARLFKAKKAPIVVVTSGDPYLVKNGVARRESDDMRDLLVEYGVPRDAVLAEGNSRTTKENAKNTADLLRTRGVLEILLVTSAYHLPRAARLFEKSGFKVIPVPTSVEVTDSLTAQDFFPRATNFSRSTMYLKEYFGKMLGR